MVENIRKGATPHLYITEWREHLHLTLDQVAGRCGVERNTIWRWENEQKRLNPQKIALLAHAFGREPEDLWRPPAPNARPSLDAMVRDAPDELFQTVRDIVSRLTKQAS